MRFPTKYTSGCRSIDDLLGGGFESGTITQLYGEAGSGKTNICIQTAVECAKSGKTVIFLDCEGFSPERFFQIASYRGDIEEIARRIIVFEAHNFEQQEKCIAEIERFIAEKGKKEQAKGKKERENDEWGEESRDSKGESEGEGDVALVILDSATVFYRLEPNEERSMQMRRRLANQILHLLELARRHDIAVIITNQVYMDIENGKLRASGGLALEHLSKVIVQLEKIGEGRRRAILKKHRSMPEGLSCEFIITERGVEDGIK